MGKKVVNTVYNGVSSIFWLSGGIHDTFRECMESITNSQRLSDVFDEFWKIEPKKVLQMLDNGELDEDLLNQGILDSKPLPEDNLFA